MVISGRGTLNDRNMTTAMLGGEYGYGDIICDGLCFKLDIEVSDGDWRERKDRRRSMDFANHSSVHFSLLYHSVGEPICFQVIYLGVAAFLLRETGVGQR